MNGYSLRRRLVLLLTLTVAIIGALSVLVVYQRAHHEADELLDNELAQVGDTLLAIVSGGEVAHVVKELDEHTHRHPVPIAFEVWRTEDGVTRRVVKSPGHAGFDATLTKSGLSEASHGGQRWRFYAVQDAAGEYRVIVGEAHAARERLAREIGLSLLLPAALALPLMALAVWWVVGRTLRPVDAVARQVAALDAQALVPLDTSTRLPREIAPLRSALNALIQRVSEALDSERRFTADAAHELRTPLAALKVQAQVALRAQTDEPRQHALAQVAAGVDRMTHLVEQLLTLARVDPARQGDMPLIDPAPVVADVCAEALPRATRQGQTLDVHVTSGCRAGVSPAWLQIALRNLVDNAVRYAGDGAHIEVHVAPTAHGCSIAVLDDGSGVAPDLRPQLAARFVRGETGGDGCGLGLSIVARVAALSHARLELGDGLPRTDGGHGFAATLRFDA